MVSSGHDPGNCAATPLPLLRREARPLKARARGSAESSGPQTPTEIADSPNNLLAIISSVRYPGKTAAVSGLTTGPHKPSAEGSTPSTAIARPARTATLRADAYGGHTTSFTAS
jgi:hypothetical protein